MGAVLWCLSLDELLEAFHPSSAAAGPLLELDAVSFQPVVLPHPSLLAVAVAPQPPELATSPQPPELATSPQPPELATSPQPPESEGLELLSGSLCHPAFHPVPEVVDDEGTELPQPLLVLTGGGPDCFHALSSQGLELAGFDGDLGRLPQPPSREELKLRPTLGPDLEY